MLRDVCSGEAPARVVSTVPSGLKRTRRARRICRFRRYTRCQRAGRSVPYDLGTERLRVLRTDQSTAREAYVGYVSLQVGEVRFPPQVSCGGRVDYRDRGGGGGAISATNPTFSKEFNLPGTDSQRATELMNENFAAAAEQQTQASTSILIAADDGLAAHSDQIDQLIAQAKTLPDIVDPEKIVNPVTLAEANPAVASAVLGDNGKVGLIQLNQSIRIEDQTQANKTAFLDLMAKFRTGGLQVEGTGSMMQVQAAGVCRRCSASRWRSS